MGPFGPLGCEEPLPQLLFRILDAGITPILSSTTFVTGTCRGGVPKASAFQDFQATLPSLALRYSRGSPKAILCYALSGDFFLDRQQRYGRCRFILGELAYHRISYVRLHWRQREGYCTVLMPFH